MRVQNVGSCGSVVLLSINNIYLLYISYSYIFSVFFVVLVAWFSCGSCVVLRAEERTTKSQEEPKIKIVWFS